jgi:polyhydroxyalkanoate synthase
VLSAADPSRLRTHFLVERWALDEFALPRRLVGELGVEIVREDRFVRGALEISGRKADPSQYRAPLLCVLDPRCELVPPGAVLPFVEAVASVDKTVLDYEGDVGVALQHVGPLVGRNAHAELWPRIIEWILRTSAR